MGTRTIIFFAYDSKKGTEEDGYEFDEKKNKLIKRAVPIYKHWDGYPSNMLHLLNQYLNVNHGRINDISYLASGFLRYIQDRGFLRYIQEYDYEEHIPEKFNEIEDPYTGYGLFTQRITRRFLDNSWADYYYKITPSKIYCYRAYEFEDYGTYKRHPKILYECDLEEFLELPDDREYFDNLEKELYDM